MAVIRRLELEVEIARQAEQDDIADTAAEHGSMPANYWQERHRLERKLEAARKILEALT